MSASVRLAGILLTLAAASPGWATDTDLTPELAQSLSSKIVLFWTPEEQRVGYRHYEKIYPSRTISRGGAVWPLPDAHVDLSGFTYEHGGESLGLSDYMERMNTAGLIIVKDGNVLLERYAFGNDRSTRWVSFSITKSVVSLLYGAAIKDGAISAVTDGITQYEPLLKGGSYENVNVRNLLQMSSGVAWNEDYTDPNSDLSQTATTLARGNDYFLGRMAALPRVAGPGTEWNYNTGETVVAGSVLGAAIDGNLSDYLSEKIWQPFGMESDAEWMLLRPDGMEYGGCCISATLRDFARIGLFAMHNGQTLDGNGALPDHWMEESLAPADTAPWYGYFWWLGQDGAFSANGIFGQRIHVVPEQNLVIAIHSLWPRATGQDLSEHRNAFLMALTDHLSRPNEATAP